MIICSSIHILSYFSQLVKFFYYDKSEKNVLLIVPITNNKKAVYTEILTFIGQTPIIMI